MDAIDQLVNFFNSKDEFLKTFVESTLFFPKSKVQKRNQELINLHNKEGKLPVRSTESLKTHWNVPNKKEAIKYSQRNNASSKGYPNIYVKVDNDGNYEVRKLIRRYFGHIVSEGKPNTIKNFTISHVWGKTDNPLFFTSLWNIVLIPAHFNYLMDKSDDRHQVVKEVKAIIKQKCIELYSPYESFLKKFNIKEDIKEEFKVNSSSKNNFQYNFVSHIDSEAVETTITNNNKDQIENDLQSIGKTFFVEYFDVFANKKEPELIVPQDNYTINSYRTRISKMNKLFQENLEVKALKNILDSNLKYEILRKAQKLLSSYD